MHSKFANFVESLEPKFQSLIQMQPFTRDNLPRNIPKSGVYLFSEGEKHFYVGRSDNIRRRLALHCRPSSQHNQATFAFRMARLETGNVRAAYTSTGSREALIKEPEFLEKFERSKARIRSMDIRFVEEMEPTRQALLEIYVSTVLDTEFNDFKNH